MWTCTGQGRVCSDRGECTGGELAGVGQLGLGESDGGWLLSDLGWLGGGGGSPAALPVQQCPAHPVLRGHDPSVCVVWNRQGEGVGRAWGGHAVPASPASTRLRGDECPVMYGTVRHPSFLGVCRLLTWCSALCHLGTSGPWGHPLQMLENLGVCVICDSWLLRGVPAPRNNGLAFLCASKSL